MDLQVLQAMVTLPLYLLYRSDDILGLIKSYHMAFHLTGVDVIEARDPNPGRSTSSSTRGP